MRSMKLCNRCGTAKPLSEFYKDASMSDGRLNQCKACVLARTNKHRKENIEYFRWYDRQRYLLPHRNKAAREIAAKWSKENAAAISEKAKGRKDSPEKYAAHLIVLNALNAGVLKRQPCIKCGNEKSEAHHEDYSKPLDVVWLCCLHHRRRHAELKRLNDKFEAREITCPRCGYNAVEIGRHVRCFRCGAFRKGKILASEEVTPTGAKPETQEAIEGSEADPNDDTPF